VSIQSGNPSVVTATATRRRTHATAVLRDVPWDAYVALRASRRNDHFRMTYLDGVLTLISPGYIHDFFADRVGMLIRDVVAAFGIPVAGARSTTLQRPGPGPKKGAGKEPDNSYYFANEARIRGRTEINLEIDPPPDLAIEVDNTRDSRRKLAVYARLGVPEVWRYDGRTETLWFGALQADGTYAPVERSLSLPMLTPGIILDLLARCRTTDETTWDNWVRDWARNELLPRHREG